MAQCGYKLIYSLLCICLCVIPVNSGFSFAYDVLKPQFEKDSLRLCSKYPFWKSYEHRLTNPTGRAVTFHFNIKGWKNGGFGDRMAGLINAAEMAIRFNRSLIIRSDSEFDKLFRPYIPSRLQSIDKWKNISYYRGDLSWARYNASNEDKADGELEVYSCVNSGPKRADFCSQAWGDPSQPNIIVLGNRAYLCHWFHSPDYVPAHQGVLKALGMGNDDLMEAAGCMLRLAMWPTDLLWTMVDEVFESHKRDLKRRGLVKHHDQALLWRYLVSTHFRCGDLGYIHGESYDLACQHSYQYNVTMNGTTQLVYNIPPHQESGYMGYATPIDIAQCAARVLENMTAESMRSWDSFLNEEEERKNEHVFSPKVDAGALNLTMDFRTIVHIASDNPGGAKQINETLLWPNTLLSPSGCHVDWDSSYECLRLTAVFWFIMANSDVIVSPGVHGITNSGFSRYAAVYGLKKDSLRDPKQCDNILTRHDLSHIQHNNWMC
jgi:hypothetical protein